MKPKFINPETIPDTYHRRKRWSCLFSFFTDFLAVSTRNNFWLVSQECHHLLFFYRIIESIWETKFITSSCHSGFHHGCLLFGIDFWRVTWIHKLFWNLFNQFHTYTIFEIFGDCFSRLLHNYLWSSTLNNSWFVNQECHLFFTE